MSSRFACLLALVLTSTSPAFATERNAPLRRIALGSCAHQDRPQPIWEKVIAARPDLFLFLGDTVYADEDGVVLLPGGGA